jgi:hypothetical protein
MDLNDIQALRRIVAQAGGFRPAERYLRSEGFEISEKTLRRRLREEPEDDYEVSEVPDRLDVNALIVERQRKFEELRRFADATQVRTVRLRSNAPIGIGFMGDAHIDDEGTNITKLLSHADLFAGQHSGLYGAFLGDVWNNWVGRLTRLWADQSTSALEAQALIEYFFNIPKWLFVLQGNHDLWNTKQDIIEYMLKSTPIVAPHEQHVRLEFPNGRQIMIHARHKFPGHSQWTKQFGQIKAATLGGQADIYVGGDKHVSGYSNGWHDGQKRMWHAIQVASYKEIDEYPVELGLNPADLYQCPVAVIDPKATSPLNLIRWEFDPHEGAKRLAWIRSRV